MRLDARLERALGLRQAAKYGRAKSIEARILLLACCYAESGGTGMTGTMAKTVGFALVMATGCSRSPAEERRADYTLARVVASSQPADMPRESCLLVDRETIRNVLGFDFVREEPGGVGQAPCSFRAKGLGLLEVWPRVDPNEYGRAKERYRTGLDVTTEMAMDEAFYVRTPVGPVSRGEDRYAIAFARKGARAVQLRLLAPDLHDDDARRVTIALAKMSFAKL